jgi:hypothetical protein
MGINDDSRLTHVRDSRFRVTNIATKLWSKFRIVTGQLARHKITPWEGGEAVKSDEYFVKTHFVIMLRHAEDFLQSDLV